MKALIKIRIPSFLFALILTLPCFGLSPTAQAQRSGIGNTATGMGALQNNTTGNYNTATGYRALFSNTSGTSNVGEGAYALGDNTTGDANIAIGSSALFDNTTGTANVAVGSGALTNNSTGIGNTALGYNAGSSLSTGNYNIDIGFNVTGVRNEANTIRIGDVQTTTFIAGISGATVASGVTVIIDTDGHLGTIVSSRDFKDAIKPMDKASEAILALKPVTFHYKQEIDPQGIPQFGLVAEDVEAVNPDLVVRDKEGKVNTVRYEAVNAMLLNEFLKEHRKIEEQQATIAQVKSTAAKQEATIARQQKQIETLTEGLQKVSAQLEESKPAPQIVLNDQ